LPKGQVLTDNHAPIECLVVKEFIKEIVVPCIIAVPLISVKTWLWLNPFVGWAEE
jgi:hypothetical protein